MLRKVTHQIKGQKDVGASGIHFIRALDEETTKIFDPFLRLDVFDSSNPDEYISGFPTRPHRGLETITFVSKGQMRHGDHLDTGATIYNGEAQWLTAGSGAKHEEYPGGESLLATQLWLNMPAKDKMTAPPAYHSITNDEIMEFPFDGGVSRLVTGEYEGVEAWQGKILSC